MKSILLFLSCLFCLVSCNNNALVNYNGTPFSDGVYKEGPQKIPGKLQCEYYDLGGEGVAFHDSDLINSGSGNLNPADGSYLNEFRINEPVDISYTKFTYTATDNSEYNLVETNKNQLYVGWTEPGEWLKYTVEVKESGVYQLGLMYTSNQGGKISLSVNDKDITGPIEIPTTYVAEDKVDWRQWHHWNYIDSMTRIELEKGVQTITLHTVENGQMNYDYISFNLLN